MQCLAWNCCGRFCTHVCGCSNRQGSHSSQDKRVEEYIVVPATTHMLKLLFANIKVLWHRGHGFLDQCCRNRQKKRSARLVARRKTAKARSARLGLSTSQRRAGDERRAGDKRRAIDERRAANYIKFCFSFRYIFQKIILITVQWANVRVG